MTVAGFKWSLLSNVAGAVGRSSPYLLASLSSQRPTTRLMN